MSDQSNLYLQQRETHFLFPATNVTFVGSPTTIRLIAESSHCPSKISFSSNLHLLPRDHFHHDLTASNRRN